MEDLLAVRGIILSYETVRRWVNHFGPKIAAGPRKRRPGPTQLGDLRSRSGAINISGTIFVAGCSTESRLAKAPHPRRESHGGFR